MHALTFKKIRHRWPNIATVSQKEEWVACPVTDVKHSGLAYSYKPLPLWSAEVSFVSWPQLSGLQLYLNQFRTKEQFNPQVILNCLRELFIFIKHLLYSASYYSVLTLKGKKYLNYDFWYYQWLCSFEALYRTVCPSMCHSSVISVSLPLRGLKIKLVRMC